MRTDKSLRDFAKNLVRISLDEEGQLSGERVQAVLEALREKPPRGLKPLLKFYLYYMKIEVRKSEAILEYAGEILPATVERVKQMLSDRYGRPISALTRENADLIAGIRVRIANDVFNASIAGHLENLAAGVS